MTLELVSETVDRDVDIDALYRVLAALLARQARTRAEDRAS
jgi:hypothetical protein